MDGKKIVEFPDVENKLQTPTKKSVFERQKELEREKRAQEEAETAAVYAGARDSSAGVVEIEKDRCAGDRGDE